MAVLSARALEHRLPDRRLLDAIDLEVAGGEAVAITGPSGSGKTTLLHLFAGILAIQSGEVLVARQNLADLDAEQRAAHRLRHIGMVFQTSELLDELTVRENVALPLRLIGTPRDLAMDRADEWLARVGVSRRADDRPATLSGGEAQRVGIARALSVDPVVVLADEPTGALDADTASTVVDLLVGSTRHTGAALVMVTHDHQVASAADRVVDLHRGRLVEAGA